jgi:hypothetical protein
MRPSRLRRGIVIFLLAFAFVDLTLIDLAFPQLCNDDCVTMAAAPQNEVSRQSEDECESPDGRDSQPDPDSQPVSTDEDCFCCCSHITPGYWIAVAPLEMTPRLNIHSPEPLLSPPPQDTFHPPRIA